MFEEINFYDLKYGIKYLITGIDTDEIYYVGIFERYENNRAKFHLLRLMNPYLYHATYRAFTYDPNRYFYQFLSKKRQIQEAMEKRALNKIIQKITGDDTFVWY